MSSEENLIFGYNGKGETFNYDFTAVMGMPSIPYKLLYKYHGN